MGGLPLCSPMRHSQSQGLRNDGVSERAPSCDLHFMEFLLRRPPGKEIKGIIRAGVGMRSARNVAARTALELHL